MTGTVRPGLTRIVRRVSVLMCTLRPMRPCRTALIAIAYGAWVCAAATLGAQSAGRPIELQQRQSPPFRELGAYYFDGLNESQIWVNIEPAHVEGGEDPIVFNATVKFPGFKLDREPATVELRPQVRCFPPVYLSRQRIPVFRLTIDSGPTIDMSPDGKTSFFIYSCGGAETGPVTFDAVTTQVPFAMLRQLA